MAARSSRWITVRVPFDYRWSSGAITAFRAEHIGEHMVKDELADFAVARGYATEGKVDGSARLRKGRKPKNRAKETAPAKTAELGPAEGMVDADVPPADRPADRPAVDHDAG
ncbi:MAG: hypothetical protein ACR652_17740 [Methylocystis sp.]|uniref:hypothetical protein n=1 Tax=Methylocystis sp. TaxID=1911079 RepID=UPI003DA62461